MSIKKETNYQSIVVLAENLNPSIFNSYWLIKNKFINENEIKPESIFSPSLVQIIASKYRILVTSAKLELVFFEDDSSDFEKIINNVLIKIIKRLKEVPYVGVGINFNYLIRKENETINDFSKALFYNPNSDFHKNMYSENTKFGAYFSKEFKKTRLKLDIKPVTLKQTVDKSKSIEFLQYSFNFHSDFDEKTAVENLIDLLNNWNLYSEESKRIISQI